MSKKGIDKATEKIVNILIEEGKEKREKFKEEMINDIKKSDLSCNKNQKNKNGLKKKNTLKIKYMEMEGSKARYGIKEEGIEVTKNNSIALYKTEEEVKEAIDLAIKEIIEEGEEILEAFEVRKRYAKYS